MRLDTHKLLIVMAREKITDAELCAVAGVPKSTFSNIKSGKRNPKPITIGKLAEALKVDPTELIDVGRVGV